MSAPTPSDETYPGRDYPLSQLLYAVKKNLHHAAFGGRIAMTANQVEVDALERDALEALCLVRSAKNSFAPINRIPLEVLSLIPDYHDRSHTDKPLIALTHVCRGWRIMFASRTSLWTRLDFKNVHRTRTYIQRSQSSPLEFYIGRSKVIDDAFALVIPHICRLKSMTIDCASFLPSALAHLRCDTPLLEKLHIDIRFNHSPILGSAFFDRDLSSLRELCLRGQLITHFPWKNLRVADIGYFHQRYQITQFLDFFESAPLLHSISLWCWMPASSDAPPERIVPLRHLKVFTIETDRPHPALLRHLHIRIGASLVSKFNVNGGESPLLEYLPEESLGLSYLSHITTVDLYSGLEQKFVQLSGPSGSLRMLGRWNARALTHILWTTKFSSSSAIQRSWRPIG